MIKELKKGYLDGIVGSYTDPPGYFADDAAVEAFDRRFEPRKEKAAGATGLKRIYLWAI
ncbi:MAG: hypothetical protein V8R80_01435 [Eubacterium sp.]